MAQTKTTHPITVSVQPCIIWVVSNSKLWKWWWCSKQRRTISKPQNSNHIIDSRWSLVTSLKTSKTTTLSFSQTCGRKLWQPKKSIVWKLGIPWRIRVRYPLIKSTVIAPTIGGEVMLYLPWTSYKVSINSWAAKECPLSIWVSSGAWPKKRLNF